MRGLDLTNGAGLLNALISIALVTLIGVGLRLVMMLTIQQRRERRNRQINERLKLLIAAYKVLGGSFTGDLSVDPTHLRTLRERGEPEGSERSRRIRDAVEAALADIILLGTEEQVALAQAAAADLVAGRRVDVTALVVSLRDFIRASLDLAPLPATLAIPPQGPARPATAGGRGARGEGERGSGGRGGAGGLAGGAGMGAGLGLGLSATGNDAAYEDRPA